MPPAFFFAGPPILIFCQSYTLLISDMRRRVDDCGFSKRICLKPGRTFAAPDYVLVDIWTPRSWVVCAFPCPARVPAFPAHSNTARSEQARACPGVIRAQQHSMQRATCECSCRVWGHSTVCVEFEKTCPCCSKIQFVPLSVVKWPPRPTHSRCISYFLAITYLDSVPSADS